MFERDNAEITDELEPGGETEEAAPGEVAAEVPAAEEAAADEAPAAEADAKDS
jgi:hypothetical protein